MSFYKEFDKSSSNDSICIWVFTGVFPILCENRLIFKNIVANGLPANTVSIGFTG